MSSIIKNIFVSIGVAFCLSCLQYFFDTNILSNFLKTNLITLLLAIMAINSATLSIVVTKIRELIDKSGADKHAFDSTKKAMILSVKEQIAVIFAYSILLILQDASFLKNNSILLCFVDTLAISCFVYAVTILYDTAKSVFVILDY